jgi:hypothetical protein
MIMSNIANILTYLRSSDAKFIRIVNQETNKTVGKTDIYLTDIPNEDLEHYIKFNLGTITAPTLVWIEMRQKKGATSIKENGCKILVDFQDPQKPQELTPQIMTPTPTQNATPIVAPAASLGNPGNQNVFGLGFAEVIGMQVKADRLDHKEEQLRDLKEDHKDLKRKYDILDTDHRATLTKLSTAEAQKEMAVMLAKLENKSVFDSPVFEKLMDQAPQLLSGFAAMKGGGMPIAGALGAPNLPAEHREFIEFVSENLNENQVNFLGSICHYINNEPFVNELKMLLTRYSTHA